MLLDIGGVNINVPPFEYVLFAMLNPVIDGVALSIVNVAVVLPEVYFVVSAWVAVIVTVPACKIDTVDPDTLAMDGAELSYENAPVLLEVGGVNVKVSPLEYVRFAIVKPEIDGG